VEALNLIDRLADLRVFRIIIGGGEPLVRNDIFDIIRHCNERKVFAAINSNGTLITQDVARQLKKLEVTKIQISLLGLQETHDNITGVGGSFDAAVLGIKNLVAEEIKVAISTPLFAQLIPSQIHPMANLLEELRIFEWKFMQFFPVGRGSNKRTWRPSLKQLREFYKLIETIKHEKNFKVTCYFPPGLPITRNIERLAGHPSLKYAGCCCGERQLLIKADGSIHPCAFLRTPQFKCGNIRSVDLADVWANSPILSRIREARLNITGKCRDCHYFKVCRGGCRSFAYVFTGDLYASDPTCHYVPSEAEDIYSFYLELGEDE